MGGAGPVVNIHFHFLACSQLSSREFLLVAPKFLEAKRAKRAHLYSANIAADVVIHHGFESAQILRASALAQTAYVHDCAACACLYLISLCLSVCWSVCL